MKAAYIPVGSGGHILSSLPMITELVKKGVEVDYYAPESQRAQVEMTGARLCVFPEVQERYSGPYMGKEEFLAVIPLVFLGMAKEAIDAIMAGLTENRPDVIIADEMALGMVNSKTTAVRIIPVIGKGVGDTVEFGGLLGHAPIMPVNPFSCEAFISRKGRIPAPIHSFKN
jgi:UDP:flavonoid glycosyltransferase YjiC (YdhE family)